MGLQYVLKIFGRTLSEAAVVRLAYDVSAFSDATDGQPFRNSGGVRFADHSPGD